MEQHQAILNSDALSNVPALTSEAYTPSDISSKFGSITYSKGIIFSSYKSIKLLFIFNNRRQYRSNDGKIHGVHGLLQRHSSLLRRPVSHPSHNLPKLKLFLFSKEGNTIPKNLFDKLDANVDPKYPLPANKKIIDIMQTWTTVGGFPYVTVSRDANTLKLKQVIILSETISEY